MPANEKEYVLEPTAFHSMKEAQELADVPSKKTSGTMRWALPTHTSIYTRNIHRSL